MNLEENREGLVPAELGAHSKPQERGGGAGGQESPQRQPCVGRGVGDEGGPTASGDRAGPGWEIGPEGRDVNVESRLAGQREQIPNARKISDPEGAWCLFSGRRFWRMISRARVGPGSKAPGGLKWRDLKRRTLRRPVK